MFIHYFASKIIIVICKLIIYDMMMTPIVFMQLCFFYSVLKSYMQMDNGFRWWYNTYTWRTGPSEEKARTGRAAPQYVNGWKCIEIVL